VLAARFGVKQLYTLRAHLLPSSDSITRCPIDGLGKRSAGFVDRDIEQTETASAGYPGSRDHDHFQMGPCSRRYDAENRIQYVDDGSTGFYVYDANGSRVAKLAGSAVTYYVYDAEGDVVAERDANNNWIQTYIRFGGGMIGLYRGANTGFLHQDHLGSTRLVTASNQSVYDNMDYLPYGEQIAGSSVTTHKFTGYERDTESGLDYASARHYSSNLGRFMSTDLLSGSPGYPQSWNRYSYVMNNPLNEIAPTGMDADDPDCDADDPCAGRGNNGNPAGGYANTDWAGVDAFSAVLSYNSTGSDPSLQATPTLSGMGASVGKGLWNEIIDLTNFGNRISNSLFSGKPNYHQIPIRERVLAENETDRQIMWGTSAFLLFLGGEEEGPEKGTTFLYEKLAADGSHLKYGITKNPLTRYSDSQLAGGRLKFLAQGDRGDMLKLERDLRSTLPIGLEERQLYYVIIEFLKGYRVPPY